MIMSLILGDTFLQKYFSIDFFNTKEEKVEARNLIGYQVVSKKEYFNNFMQINTLQSNTVCRFQSINKKQFALHMLLTFLSEIQAGCYNQYKLNFCINLILNIFIKQCFITQNYIPASKLKMRNFKIQNNSKMVI